MLEVTLAKKERFEAVKKRAIEAGDTIDESVSYEQVREFLDRREFDLGFAEEMSLMAFEAAPELAEIFYDMNWHTFRTASNQTLVTSDTPLTHGSPRETHHPLFGDGGLMNDAVEAHFPLDRRHLFVASWKELPNRIEMPPNYANHVNWRTIRTAFRHAYASINSDAFAAWANESKGIRKKLSDPRAPNVVLRRGRTKPSQDV